MRKISIFLFIFIISIYSNSRADKAPISFGKVTMEELTMERYEPDTSAPAVILCNYGYFNSNDFEFTQVIRIKIFKKEGYDWANRAFPGYNKAMVRGITFNLENGEIVESKLKPESIFRENIVNERSRIRISMPNVKEGSIIDIKYTYSWIPSEWRFQEVIPVVHSELKMERSQYVTFRKNLFGFVPLTLNEDDHWIAQNMPAFKPEPYISSPENYLTKIEFDILDIHIATYYESVTKSWELLCSFMDEGLFGEALRHGGYLSSTAKEILAVAKSDEEKLKMAHEFMKSFKWNEYESVFPSNSNLKFVFDDHSGNSADINLALIQLLERLEFDVKPVLLSTRENGILSPVYPSLNKLNYVIGRVKLNDKYILIDGTEQYTPYYLLPERCLNYFGRLCDDKNSELIDLVTDLKEKQRVMYTVALSEDLIVKGTLSNQRFDYAALDFRKGYHQFTSEESYLESLLENFPGLRINKADIKNVDSIYLPVIENYDIIMNNQVDQIGENLYLYPMFYHRMEENPFKSNERKYPVDFIHNLDKTYIVNLTIPEGYEVSLLPESISMKLPDNSAYFYYQISNFGNAIQFSFKYGTNKTVFVETEYHDIKEFFNQIIAKHAEPIVLKKT
ncbi:MAG: DUF3857 domain-containing protein [Bacteroidales bacterium]|nr:DUF3857 domain-containing protein [Bacteroidales bacterium]